MPYKDPEIRKVKANARWKKWASNNKEAANKRMRDWRQRNPSYMLFQSAKRRSKESGLLFDITIDDIPIVPEMCPVAQIPIFPRNDGTKGPCDNSPTLDRHNPEAGYVKGNLRVISHRANRWKNSMTISDVKRLLDYMENG